MSHTCMAPRGKMLKYVKQFGENFVKKCLQRGFVGVGDSGLTPLIKRRMDFTHRHASAGHSLSVSILSMGSVMCRSLYRIVAWV